MLSLKGGAGGYKHPDWEVMPTSLRTFPRAYARTLRDSIYKCSSGQSGEGWAHSLCRSLRIIPTPCRKGRGGGVGRGDCHWFLKVSQWQRRMRISHQVQAQIPAPESSHLSMALQLVFWLILAEDFCRSVPLRIFQWVSWPYSPLCFGAKRSQWLLQCCPKVTEGQRWACLWLG